MDALNSDIAFTPAVKTEQKKRGSRDNYQKMSEKRDWSNTVNEALEVFIAERNSFYLATATKDGQPYIQHRGGPKGFLKVIDERTLGFADYAGNRQYISIGNAAENDKAYIFLMDYLNQRRIKLWGKLRVVEGDADLLERLSEEGYRARPERVFLFEISAWDVNCPQHIPQMFDLETVEIATSKLTERVKELEAEVAQLRETMP
jgi:uncharacterized protein